MRLAVLLIVLAPGAACTAPRLYGEGVELRTHFSGGAQVIDHDVVDGHPVVGLEFATVDSNSGWGYELGGQYGSEDEGGPRDRFVEMPEAYLGLRRTWVTEGSSRQPYVGFGGSWVRVHTVLDAPDDDFTNDSPGGYAHGGILWSLGNYEFDKGTQILVGFDARAVVGDEVDYGQLALVLGFGR